MKRNKEQNGARQVESHEESGVRHDTKPLSKANRRKWLFRCIAILSPVILLILTEITLKIFGYGRTTSFLLQKEIQSKTMMVENAWFGLRFFPPALVRSPSPTIFPKDKPAGTYRIFLFGESAILGDPQPSYGVGRYLESMLHRRYPGTEFEVIPAAMTAINSHGVYQIAKEFVHYQGDQWIVYMGNNEYVGPFGANTVFGPQAPSHTIVRAYLALKKWRLGQWLTSISRLLRRENSDLAGWTGLRLFLDHPLSPQDIRRNKVSDNFRHNLTDIVKLGQQRGIPMLLCTVSSNLKDCAPFSSMHNPPLDSSKQSEWQSLREKGAQLMEQKLWREAGDLFEKACKLSPHFAEIYFQLGQCYLGMSNSSLALSNFSKARDLDALPFRTDSRLNIIVKEVAQKYGDSKTLFFDTEEYLNQKSPNQILGKELLYEHVHLNFEGNYQLALALAEKIATNFPPHISKNQREKWPTHFECAEDLGLTDLNRSMVINLIIGRISEPPYTAQLNHAEMLKYWNGELTRIKQKIKTTSKEDLNRQFEGARKAAPKNHWLRRNEAEYLEGIGDIKGAITQWQAVRDLTPHHQVAYFQLGRLYARLKQWDQARNALETSLQLRPDLLEAYLELGQVYANQENQENALQMYAKAQKLRPDEPRIFLKRATLYLSANQHDLAIANLKEAIQLRPSYWEAHYLMGIELAMQEKFAEAQTEFETTLRYRPNHVSANFNLAVALAKQHRYSDAIAKFQDTLRLDPTHQQARQYLNALQAEKK